VKRAWAYIDPALMEHPKCIQAGFWGATIYMHLILISRANGFGGKIPEEYSSPEFLASYLKLQKVKYCTDPVKLIQFGIEKATKAELICNLDNGLELLEKSIFHFNSSTERSRKWRRLNKELGRKGTNGTKRDALGTKRDASPEAMSPQQKNTPHEARQLADSFVAAICKNHPGSTLAKLTGERKATKILQWSNVFRIMHQRDKHSWEDMGEMIEWFQNDIFWVKVIVSPEGLRKHWDKLLAKKQGGDSFRKDVRFGRCEPHPHDSYPSGEVKL